MKNNAEETKINFFAP